MHELESSLPLSLYRLCVSILDTQRQEIKIESRSRRVLTILGRLSSDLQPIVNLPPFLSLSLPAANSRRVSTLPSFLSVASSSTDARPSATTNPPTSRFLNPRRFRPLEFESTAGKIVESPSVHMLACCHAYNNEGVRVLDPSPSRPNQERGRARREIERIFRATSHAKMFRSRPAPSPPPPPSLLPGEGTDLSEKSRRKIRKGRLFDRSRNLSNDPYETKRVYFSFLQ